MKKFILLAALPFFFAACEKNNGTNEGNGSDVLTGTITEDLTLEEGREYKLSGGLHVQAPATLTIEPGVTITAVYDDVTVEEFMTYWLEDVMKIRITACSYDAYANIVNNHILPFFRAKNLRLINNIKMAHVQQLYNEKANYSHAVARLVKTVMNTSMEYARTNNIISRNPAKGVNLPKSMEIKKGFRTRSIDASKTLTLEQIKVLLDKSRDTPIHMQILFAVLMGLRRGEINGLKYSDVDYMNQTLTVRRQLGKAPNTVREDFQAKTFTKQEIRLKTDSSYRTLPIPDYVFEEILKERRREQPLASYQRIYDLKRFVYDTGKPWCKTTITHTIGTKEYKTNVDKNSFQMQIKNSYIKYNPQWGLTEWEGTWDPKSAE